MQSNERVELSQKQVVLAPLPTHLYPGADFADSLVVCRLPLTVGPFGAEDFATTVLLDGSHT